LDFSSVLTAEQTGERREPPTSHFNSTFPSHYKNNGDGDETVVWWVGGEFAKEQKPFVIRYTIPCWTDRETGDRKNVWI
jgi:hypothetical protein